MVHPVFRGIATYAFLWPSSELTRQVGQELLNGKQLENLQLSQLDFSRALNFALYGGLYSAPAAYFWMTFLVRKIPGRAIRHIIFKTGIDQVIYAPFSICCFYTGINLLEGKTFKEIRREIQAKFFLTYASGLGYWPFVQAANFLLVPAKNRVVFTGLASFLWTVYLSFVKDKELVQS